MSRYTSNNKTHINRYHYKPAPPPLLSVTTRTTYLPKLPPALTYNSNTRRSPILPVGSYGKIAGCRTLCKPRYHMETISRIYPSVVASMKNQKPYGFDSVPGDHSIGSGRVYSNESSTSNSRGQYSTRSAGYNNSRNGRTLFSYESIASIKPTRHISKSPTNYYPRKCHNVYSSNSFITSTRPRKTYMRDSLTFGNKSSVCKTRASSRDEFKNPNHNIDSEDSQEVFASAYSDEELCENYQDIKSEGASLSSQDETPPTNMRAKCTDKKQANSKFTVDTKSKNKIALFTRLFKFRLPKTNVQNTKNDLVAYLENSEESDESCAKSKYTSNELKRQKVKKNDSNMGSDYCKRIDNSSSVLMGESEDEKHFRKFSRDSSYISRKSRNSHTHEQMKRNHSNDERTSRANDFNEIDDCSSGTSKVHYKQMRGFVSPPSVQSKIRKMSADREPYKRESIVQYVGAFPGASTSSSDGGIITTPRYTRDGQNTIKDMKHVNTENSKDTRKCTKEPRSRFLRKINTVRGERESAEPKPSAKSRVDDLLSEFKMSDTLCISKTTNKEPQIKRTNKEPPSKPNNKEPSSKQTKKEPTSKPTNKGPSSKATNKELPSNQNKTRSSLKQTNKEPPSKRTNKGPPSKQTNKEPTPKPTNKETTSKRTNKETKTKPTKKETTTKPTNKETISKPTNRGPPSKRTNNEPPSKQTKSESLSKESKTRSSSNQTSTEPPSKPTKKEEPSSNQSNLQSPLKQPTRSRFLRSLRQNHSSRRKCPRPSTKLRSHSHKAPAGNGYAPILRLRF